MAYKSGFFSNNSDVDYISTSQTSATASQTSATAAALSAAEAAASVASITSLGLDKLAVSRDEDEILTVDSAGTMVWESAPDQLTLNGGYY